MFFRLAIIVVLTIWSAPLASEEPADTRGTQAVDSTPRPTDDSVYDENWLSIGLGAALIPSYEGSNNYVLSPIPLVQGKIGFVRIQPRPAGLALDFLPKPEAGLRFSLGTSMRYRANRTGDVEDAIVALAGELDSAFEIGPSAGIGYTGLLHPEDSISLNLDTRWDVSGAHSGFVFEPNANYFTPLSRGVAVSLTVGVKFIDDDFADYYFSLTPEQSIATGLPEFEAKGGLKNLNSTLFLGFDLDGNLNNGGPAVFIAGGYTRFFQDAAATPFTSVRGDADQFVGAFGVGYTF